MDSISRLAWLTDLHLDFCDGRTLSAFLDEIRGASPGAILLSGDIATGETVVRFLRFLEEALPAPIYFVLGNHDSYHGSIRDVARRVAAIGSDRLRWLSRSEPVELDRETALVGHDGWADGRYGDYAGSGVMLNDFRLIRDFRGLDARGRLARMQELAAEAADHLARAVQAALAGHRRVIVVTHVPPFDAAAWHEGKMSAPDFLPFFSSRIAGDVLRAEMARRPDREMLVLCGHTHGSGDVRILPNLRVLTGGAVYERPSIAGILDLGTLDLVPPPPLR